MKGKRKINDFLVGYKEDFLALSIFLLITFTLAFNQGSLNKGLGVLSAGISYFLMLEIIFREKGDENLSLILFNTFMIFFTLTFCIWVILNLILPLKQSWDYIIFILWAGFIFVVPFKIGGRINKIILTTITLCLVFILIIYLLSLMKITF